MILPSSQVVYYTVTPFFTNTGKLFSRTEAYEVYIIIVIVGQWCNNNFCSLQMEAASPTGKTRL